MRVMKETISETPHLPSGFGVRSSWGHRLRIVRGIVIKGIGMEYLWTDTAILAAMGVLTLFIASYRIRKSLA